MRDVRDLRSMDRNAHLHVSLDIILRDKTRKSESFCQGAFYYQPQIAPFDLSCPLKNILKFVLYSRNEMQPATL